MCLKCKCDDKLILMAILVTHVARGEVSHSQSFIVKPSLQGPSDTCPGPSSRSAAARAHNPSLMRQSRRLLCPLALWIRKVLLWLSGGVSNIDLNSLTWLIPDGCAFTPQPLNSCSHCIILMMSSQSSWKPAQSALPRPNKLHPGKRGRKTVVACFFR